MKTLLIIDLQNDFMPGGSLAVPKADELVPIINELMPNYPLVVATQDWHPAEHGSFAANHPGAPVFSQGTLAGLPQTLWPVHCVQNTGGACFAPGLDSRKITKIFPKGENAEIDSYSGFFDNGQRAATGLHPWLQSKQVSELTVVGVATDYCVKFTVLDALRLGYRVNLLANGCRGVDLQPGDVALALETMAAAGAVIC